VLLGEVCKTRGIMSEPTHKSQRRSAGAIKKPPEAVGDIFIGRMGADLDVRSAVASALQLEPNSVVMLENSKEGAEEKTLLNTGLRDDERHAALLPVAVGQVSWKLDAVIGADVVLPLALKNLSVMLKTRVAYDRKSQEHDDHVDVYFPDGTMQEGLLRYHAEVDGLENYKFDMNVRPTFLDKVGAWIANRITSQSSGYEPYTPSDPKSLLETLQPGDVLLVEGNQKVSAAIKYLTQSTWSHAALYVGDALPNQGDGPPDRLIEVNLGEGCVARPLEKYTTYNTRICRPVGISDEERKQVVDYMITRLGTAYDTRNILDMARYLIPVIPVPTRWRRKMIAFGSGDPTRAICSTLIAQAFQVIRYPILPSVKRLEDCLDDDCEAYAVGEVYHIRHHSLFAPRDFDVSPYFKIIKPTLSGDFNFRDMIWHDGPETPEDPKT